MPKAQATGSRTKTTRDAPISRPSTKKPPAKTSTTKKTANKPKKETEPTATPDEPEPAPSTRKPTRPTKKPQQKDPKASHLYTDDNPSTTLHGTGFSSLSAANATLDLISARSLTYQRQTVNTLYHRAKGHPHRTAGIESAISVFEHWLTQTYHEQKDAQDDFKPLLSKKAVQRFLPLMRKDDIVDERFAEMYVLLAPRKRLANMLVDEGDPKGRDWEAERLAVLRDLVPEGRVFGEDELEPPVDIPGWKWMSSKHLQLIAWAWSPLKESQLPREGGSKK